MPKTIVFPDIIPKPLDPPDSYYLSWPAWERFRAKTFPGLPLVQKALYLPDPPNFEASLSSLLKDKREGGDFSPYILKRPTETIEEIRGHLLGSLTPEPKTSPAPLILAIFNYTEALDREAGDFLALAREKEKNLWTNLLDEETQKTMPETAPRSLGASQVKTVWKAWLGLAENLIEESDNLWTRRDEFLEEALKDLNQVNGFFHLNPNRTKTK